MRSILRSTTVAFLLAGLTTAAAAQTPNLGTEQQREAGRVLYEQKCAQCHGINGDAVAPATAHLRPQPRDFTAGTFKFRTTTSGELAADDDLRRSIRDGMPYTSMPAWAGVLSNAEIDNLVFYIKTFNDDFSGPYGIPTRANLPEPPSFSEETAARGRGLFEENQCVDCHGSLGRGDGKSAETLTDQWDLSIRPADLTKRWTFRNGGSRADIFRTFTTGLDGSPMPSYDLPEDEAWALVDYVYSLSDDDPNYATVVTSQAVEGALDLSQADALFADAPMARFPTVGQLIEPGRSYMPPVTDVMVQAVHNVDEIAFRVAWHDISAQTAGTNSPATPVGMQDSVFPDTSLGRPYADAVALQFPSLPTPGVKRPYFVFGDPKNAVDLWFVEAATGTPSLYVGNGSSNVAPATPYALDGNLSFDQGRWTAHFKRARTADEGLSFNEDTFVPVVFTVWDGLNHETGNKRGISSWYHVYVEPLERPSAIGPMLMWGGLTLLLGLGVVGLVRFKHKDSTD